MSNWKCDICGKEFENFQAQGFDNKVYCPLCFFKEKINRLEKIRTRLKEENELLKKVKQYCPYDKKCGELYDCTKEEYETMKQSNVKLSLKYDQLKEVIEEVNNIIKMKKRTLGYDTNDSYLRSIEEILDKAKEKENENR